MTAFLVAAVAGAMARYAAELGLDRRTAKVPVWLFVVNIVGSAILGAVVALANAGRVSPDVVLTVGTGFCGALTTFSAFSLAVLRAAAAGWRRAAALCGGMVVACTLAAAAGSAAAGVL